jgi:hypothetical protein
MTIHADILEARARTPFREAAATGMKREIVIIEAGWGSSGYYSEQVLERDIPRIFPVGTHMYLDHPTRREDAERPERSVRDLVGVVSEAPRMSGIASVAVAEIFEHWVPVIDAMAEHIGLSIRAFGTTEQGDAGGKTGSIIKTLTEGVSIDYVTLAGAGGEVGPLAESAREKVLPLIESAREQRPKEEALNSDISSSLEKAGEEKWGSKEPYTYVYCEDFDIDDNWAVFSIRPSGGDRVLRRISFVRNTDGDVALTGEGEEVERVTTYEPVEEEDLFTLADSLAAEIDGDDEELQESESLYDEFLERSISKDERVALAKKGQAIPVKDGDGNIVNGRFPMANCGDVKAAAMSVGRSKQDNIKSFIKRVASKLSCPIPFKESGSGRETKEARMGEEQKLSELQDSVRQLQEAQKDSDKKVADLEESGKKDKDRADRNEEALQMREAGQVVADALAEHEGLPKRAESRVIENSLRGELPTDGDGKLDKSALQERARAKLREEIEYIGEATGRGKVRGHGSSDSSLAESGSGNGGGSDKDKTALQEAFESRGMDESQAKAAAEGR